MATRPRPLSPHLTIYRWPITMILSIMHRATGVVLSIGMLVFIAWIATVAFNESGYDFLLLILKSWLGQVTLFLWSFAFFLHFCNGIRHLYWDTGRGFNKDKVELSARLVLLGTTLLTSIFWLIK
ncbi:MAG: succinate dehydrogenase / fumarate reductase cytochrome b subunit [Woeseiaceae bacterium]|jgi:succinate dehydrogenase / fumarate reductase cytochrome b subunit|tara:strand:- start:48532 stop:48906 length:375 start_codon:yes stop_codon:yes gene_type:complete